MFEPYERGICNSLLSTLQTFSCATFNDWVNLKGILSKTLIVSLCKLIFLNVLKLTLALGFENQNGLKWFCLNIQYLSLIFNNI